MQNFSDPDFIKRVINKDKEALAILVDSYTDHLFKASLGMGFSEEMARDLTNNTWLTFLDVVPRFEGRSHIRTFLFGIFYNKVSELRRENFKFDKTDPIEEKLESSFLDDGHWSVDFTDPSVTAQNKELMKVDSRCMEHLPEMQRTAFYMKQVSEEGNKIICEALNITETNLRQLVFRAKNRIRDCVENHLAS